MQLDGVCVCVCCVSTLVVSRVNGQLLTVEYVVRTAAGRWQIAMVAFACYLFLFFFFPFFCCMFWGGGRVLLGDVHG